MNLLTNRNIDREVEVVVHIKITEVVIKEVSKWYTKLK